MGKAGAVGREDEFADLRALRLLVALDALLTAGSVGGGARRLGLSPAATSRLLGQIREVTKDPVLIRAGRKMVPSPRAEALRPRLRALVAEAQALLDPAAGLSAAGGAELEAGPAGSLHAEGAIGDVPGAAPASPGIRPPGSSISGSLVPESLAPGGPPSGAAAAGAGKGDGAGGRQQPPGPPGSPAGVPLEGRLGSRLGHASGLTEAMAGAPGGALGPRPVAGGPGEEAAARLAGLLAVIGRSAGHARPLSAAEAEEALDIVLRGAADPVQVGALFSVLSHRSPTAPELAGLVRAARRRLPAPAGGATVHLDWPAYVPPQARRALWFLQSAVLVVRAGYRVLLHGHAGTAEAPSRVETAARALGIAVCASLAEAGAAVAQGGIAFLTLGAVSPQLHGLLALNRYIEARAPVNALLHLLNPLGAPVVLAGPVWSGYPELHRDAAAVLGMGCLALGGGRDVAELAPAKPVLAYWHLEGRCDWLVLPCAEVPARQPLAGLSMLEFWLAVWVGTIRDARAREVIVGTAALALLSLSGGGEAGFAACRAQAEELWEQRHA